MSYDCYLWGHESWNGYDAGGFDNKDNYLDDNTEDFMGKWVDLHMNNEKVGEVRVIFADGDWEFQIRGTNNNTFNLK